MFYCFWMFVNKLFTYLTPHISKSERCFTVKSSTHCFYMKKRSVPLSYFLVGILVPIVQFTKVASSVLLTKRTGFSELWTRDYYQFQQVFIPNQDGNPSIDSWWLKLHWRLVTSFDWLNSDVTMVTKVTSWISELNWLT